MVVLVDEGARDERRHRTVVQEVFVEIVFQISEDGLVSDFGQLPVLREHATFKEDECVRVPVANEALIAERQLPIVHRIRFEVPRFRVLVVLWILIEYQFGTIQNSS